MAKINIDEIIKHQLYLHRLETGLVNNQVASGLTETYKAIRAILNDKGVATTPKQLAALEASIAKAVRSNNSWSMVTDELENVAVYEAGVTGEQIAEIAAVKAVADKVIINYVNESFMSLESGKRVQSGLWPQFVEANIDSQIKQINDIIRTGYAREQTLSQVGKTIRETFEGVIKRDADTLARTGFSHYTNSARDAWADSNSDLDLYAHAVFTFDNRISETCRYLSTQKTVWEVNDPRRPKFPAHFNCLTGDTLVSTCSDVSNIYKRAYKGKIVKITTESGRSIRITPNHPILTSTGWVDAQLVNRGDDLFCIRDDSFLTDYKNKVKTTFAELYSAVDVVTNSSSVTNCPTTTKDFHGDVTDTDVNIINVDSLGWDSVREGVLNHIENNRLVSGSFVKSTLKRLCSLNLSFDWGLSSPTSLVGRTNKVRNLLRSAPGHSSELLLRTVSRLTSVFGYKLNNLGVTSLNAKMPSDPIAPNSIVISDKDLFGISSANLVMPSVTSIDTSSNKPIVDASLTKSDNIGDFLAGHVGLGSELDKIIDISICDFSGHVYNLENNDNWYTSNGIVTHNCRSFYVYLPKSSTLSGTRSSVGGQSGDEAAEAFAKRESNLDKRRNNPNIEGETSSKARYRGKKDANIFKAGQVRADTELESWLKTQPSWFVDDTLGATKGKLFRSGEFRLESFYDATGKPLTLTEIQSRHPEKWLDVIG